jgi:hypothetical protein
MVLAGRLLRQSDFRRAEGRIPLPLQFIEQVAASAKKKLL